MANALRNARINTRAEPKKTPGARVPLFDRLIDEDPESETEVPSKRYYDRAELIQSIEREVDRILNTRSTVKREEYEDFSEDPLNFGLPEMFGLGDFSQYDATKSNDWPRIAELCEQAMMRYEPRIKNVVATVIGFDKKTQSLSMTITADFAIKEFQGELTFPTVFLMGSR
jgi:type VI secretion system lysozyme-like protein